MQVFVAGATGRLGCRVVLELLRNKKLKVRAGARNPEEARSLVKAATDYGLLTGEQARRLTVVPVDLEDEDSIAPAVGNAGRVSNCWRCSASALHLSKALDVQTEGKEKSTRQPLLPLCIHDTAHKPWKCHACVVFHSLLQLPANVLHPHLCQDGQCKQR